MHYIYVIKNSVNDKVYVGQTHDFSQRKAGHLHSAKKNDMRPLYCAMREIGATNFVFEILEECEDKVLAAEREKYWVERFNSFNSGYNLTSGGGYHIGNKGRKFSEDHKRKIAEANSGKRTLTEESRRKMSESAKRRLADNHPMRGKHFSEDVRVAMSQAKKELYASEKGEEIKQKIRETLTGKTLSDEHKSKISEAGKGRKHSEESLQKMRSHVFSEEHRRKLSEAAKLRKYSS